MISIFVTIRIKEGYAQEFTEASFGDAQGSVRDEPGCFRFDILANADDPNLFHLYEEHVPRHSKIYTDLIPIIEDVYLRYMDDVRNRVYPGPEHTAYMADAELKKLMKMLDWKPRMKKTKAEREAAERAARPAAAAGKPVARKPARAAARKKK